MRTVWAVAWYRFAATFAPRRGSYLTLAVLIGLLGGLAIGAAAGARRTLSSYSTYLAGTRPPDLTVFSAFDNPSLGFRTGYDPVLLQKLAHLPYVRREQAVVGFDGNIDQVKAHLAIGPGEKPPVLEGILGTEYLTVDRAHLDSGRMLDPHRPGDAVMNSQAAKELGLHLGSTLRVTLNSDAQEARLSLPSGPSSLPPAKALSVRMVGIVTLPRDVADDDYETLGSGEVLLSPALTRQLASCCATYSFAGLNLLGGSAHLGAVEAGYQRLVPTLTAAVGFQTLAPAESRADRAIKPEAVALGVFGAMAGLAAIVIAGQVIGRQVRRQSGDLTTLRALGASPRMTLADSLTGVAGAIVAGSGLAVLVAYLLSLLFPVGPVRPVTPVGPAFDATALGAGFLVLVVALGAAAWLTALRWSPQRQQSRAQDVRGRPSGPARIATAFGLPTPAVTGVRFALENEAGPEAVPVRSAIVGAVLAMLVIVATVTFGASLNSLVGHPRLYGWNWDYALLSGFSGDEDLPAAQTSALLDRDPHVVAASGVYFDSLNVGPLRDVPVIGASPDASVGPPVMSGHGLESPGQVVLGPSVLAALHQHLGGYVIVSAGGGPRRRLEIVGTTIFPAITSNGLGTGALVDYHLIPPAVRDAQGNSVPGPNAFLVRTRGNRTAALRSLAGITLRLNNAYGGVAGGAVGALRPTEIVDSQSIEEIPSVLGAGLGAGAVVALGITLVASVRRRRRDLAVLKVLGFSGRQLATIVAWQSTVSVAIGAVIGVPLGIVVGRALWDLFANDIVAVPEPSVPALVVAVVAVGSLLLGNLVAVVPGRLAARTPTALLLRAE